ncbi:unnamed protein product, partial [Leptidea sinapis]
MGLIGEVNDVKVHVENEVNSSEYDAVLVLSGEGVVLPQVLEDFIIAAQEFDAALDKEVGVLRCPRVSGARLVVSPLVPALLQYADVRTAREASVAGVKRAGRAGVRRLLLALTPLCAARWPRASYAALLAALEALYVPLQIREWSPKKRLHPIERLGVYCEGLWTGEGEVDRVVREAVAVEAGLGLARDLGGADPERMAPARFAEFVEKAFAGSAVRVRVDRDSWRERYPLMAAVSRAADHIDEHRGCVVYLEYEPETYEETLMFVGKGVTYDTGGADVKTGGAMSGMSRDKCGAANIAGLFKVCAGLRPAVKLVGVLGVVRNSVGSRGYVSDELLVSRGRLAVRVGNTDAEGRMVMADLLHEMAERAALERAPHVFTVATLTGHAARAMGPYTAAMDNHVARHSGYAHKLAAAGEDLGDMVRT